MQKYKDVAHRIDYKIKLVDSYNILTHSLSKLCEKYSTDVIKDIFPYKGTVLNNLVNKLESVSTFNDVSMAIASAVTNYARVLMNKVK
jgi:hypothetical protein